MACLTRFLACVWCVHVEHVSDTDTAFPIACPYFLGLHGPFLWTQIIDQQEIILTTFHQNGIVSIRSYSLHNHSCNISPSLARQFALQPTTSIAVDLITTMISESWAWRRPYTNHTNEPRKPINSTSLTISIKKKACSQE